MDRRHVSNIRQRRWARGANLNTLCVKTWHVKCRAMGALKGERQTAARLCQALRFGCGRRRDGGDVRASLSGPWLTNTMADCKHLDEIRQVRARTKGCEECLRIGDQWVHLRLCLSCGHVGCCDSSKNKHATKHFHGTRHPLIRSLEPGESWGWCYIDELTLDFA